MVDKIRDTSSENKAFCILPWVHLALRPKGDVYPCCRISEPFIYDNIKNKSLHEIWNGPAIKKLRQDMLAGKTQNFCNGCYDLEKNGIDSYRQIVNKVFEKDYSRISITDESGQLNVSEIPYLDLRFSNVCNLKCRTCNLENSSSWYEDEKKLNRNFKSDEKDLSLTKINSEIKSEIEAQIPSLKYLYFAGGEPLLDKNHYELLEKIIAQKRTDIVISYNTNLSVLVFQKWNALQLWSLFDSVHLSVSIDGAGDHNNWLRKGSNWQQIVDNIKKVQVMLPNVRIEIYSTISILNCFEVIEAIRYFLDSGFLKNEYQFKFNLVTDPDYISLSVLSDEEKSKLSNHYFHFLSEIKPIVSNSLHNYLKKQFDYILNINVVSNYSELRGKFIDFTTKLDSIRSEKSSDYLKHINLNSLGNQVT